MRFKMFIKSSKIFLILLLKNNTHCIQLGEIFYTVTISLLLHTLNEHTVFRNKFVLKVEFEVQ